MEPKEELPFRVGQQAESKSFEDGYRGSWFRCKIADIRKTKGHTKHALEFFDFPDEEIGWTRLYQMPPYRVSQEERKMHLMVRPSFPPIYRESEMPDICDISEVIVIVEDDWKVGDLVDWWTDDCYWSGRITRLLEEDKVQVKLQDPPIGEGRCYEVSRKDLRPSLDWSPEHGWTVPTSLDNEHSRCCARLIEPEKQDKRTNIGPSKEEASVVCKAIGPSKVEASVVSKAICPSKEEASVVSKAIGPSKVEASVVSKPIGPCKEEASVVSSATSVSSASSVSSGTSFSSLGSPGTSPSPELSSLPPQEAQEKISGCGPNEEKRGACTYKGLDLGNAGMGIPSSSDSASSTRVDQSSAATNKHTGNGDWFKHDEPSEKMQVRGQDPLHSSVSGTIESSIMELEELVNKVKWLKRVHQFGFNCANSVTPSWKFLEDRANFTRK